MKARVALVSGAREAHGLTAALRAAGLARSTWYYHTRTRVTYGEKYAHLEAPLKAVAEAHPEYGYRRGTAELRETYGHRLRVDRPAALGGRAALLRPSRARRQPGDGKLLRSLQGGEPFSAPRRRITGGTQRSRPRSDQVLQSGAPSLLPRRPATLGNHSGALPRGLNSTTHPEVRCPTFGGHFTV